MRAATFAIVAVGDQGRRERQSLAWGSLMRMKKQRIRCFAEHSDGLWVSYCVDLGLGAQAESFEDAKRKLEDQIRDLTPEEAYQLLQRGAPLWVRARYWYAWSYVRLAKALGYQSRSRKRFSEPLPLTC